MEHEPYRSQLPLYLTGDLEDVGPLEGHLAQCAECRRELIAEQATLDLLQGAAEREDDGVDLGGFFDARIAPALRRGRWVRPLLLRAAALLLAFGCGVAVERAWPEAEEPAKVIERPALEEAYREAAKGGSSLSRALLLFSNVARDQ